MCVYVIGDQSYEGWDTSRPEIERERWTRTTPDRSVVLVLVASRARAMMND